MIQCFCIMLQVSSSALGPEESGSALGPEEPSPALGPEESGSALGPEAFGSALGAKESAEFGGTPPLKRKRANQKNTTNPLSATRRKPVAVKKRSRNPPAQTPLSGWCKPSGSLLY